MKMDLGLVVFDLKKYFKARLVCAFERIAFTFENISC